MSLFLVVSVSVPRLFFIALDDRTLHWLSSSHSSHVARACVILLWVLFLDLVDFSIHFFSFLIISLVTLLFLLPDNFNFHDVVDKYPAYFH